MEIAPAGPPKGTKDVRVLRSTSSPNNHNDTANTQENNAKGNKKSRSTVGGGTKVFGPYKVSWAYTQHARAQNSLTWGIH
ncbi:hypothetical protein L484_022913 [Morus notabilis]|uniref:Uncharacterized protein n=1 Tax=Morus notabilis TaxID=981085 RepID=W9R3W5_9ROSA|nr:hypothetical protein L484_022913 [Morus notabilis]